MNTLSRFTLVVTLMVAFVLTAVSADKTFKVVQKFSKENIIGHNGNIYMADVNGDGHKDIVARWSRNKKLIGGVWLWKGAKFADSVSCLIDLGIVTEAKVATGDLNGDGMADLAFLSQYPTAHAPKIVFGRATWPDSIKAPDLRCAFEDTGFTAQDQYSSMAIADLNGDGYGDLVYQLQGNDNNGPYSGLYGGRLIAFFGGAPMDSIADWVYAGGKTYTMTVGKSTAPGAQ